MRVLVGLICLGLFVVPALAADKIADRVSKLELTEEQLYTIGETIFNTEGANTCLKCHGAGGHGGDQVGAADLRHPRTWRFTRHSAAMRPSTPTRKAFWPAWRPSSTS